MHSGSFPRKLIRFSAFELDVAGRQLTKRGKRVKVQDLPFRLLVALLERPGETVTRQELRTRLWGDTAVEVDDGLHTAVRKLRDVLNDSATRPRFIGTVPRQGYCFLAPVELAEATLEAEATVETETAECPDDALPGESSALPVPAAPELPAYVREHSSWRPGKWILVALAVFALGCVLLAPGWGIHVPDPPMEIVPITSYPGPQGSPTLSPDGGRVAFIWVGNAGDNLDLYVQRIDGTGRTRLTTDPAREQCPAWSPSGGTIAFVRNRDLLTIPATGGQESRLTTAAGPGLSWSPDSQQIAFSDYTANGRRGVFLISVVSGERQQLTFPANGGEEDVRPAFAPDGRSIAFIRNEGSTSGIFRVAVTGGSPTRVARPGMRSAGLAWSPDGKFLLFATGRLAPGLLVVSADARDTTSLRRLDVGGSNVHDLSIISRRGGREIDLAYGQKSTNWDILGKSIGNDDSAPHSLAASNRPDDAPSFSPDGQRIAFSSSRTGSEEIWEAMADGSQPRRLTDFKSGVTTSPRWSPDGNSIAFEAAPGGTPDIYIVRREGGAPVRITSDGSSDIEPNWSHDGRWLYFASDRSGVYQIWKAPVNGGAAVQVTKGGGVQPFASDDGRYVYYAKQERGRGIWRVPVDGGPAIRFSERPWENFWTVAGGNLYYLDVGDRLLQLLTVPGPVPVRRMDLSSGKTSTVTTLEASFPTDVSELDVSRDGRHLAWVSWRERTTELILVRNPHIAP